MATASGSASTPSVSAAIPANAEERNKRLTWTDVETWTLISIWEDNLSRLRSHRRSFRIFEEIANELRRNNIERTVRQVQMKIDALTQKYRKEKRIRGTGTSPSKWPRYQELHRILGKLPVNNCRLVQDSFGEEQVVQSIEDRESTTEGHVNPDESVASETAASSSSSCERSESSNCSDRSASSPAPASGTQQNTRKGKKNSALMQLIEIQKGLAKKYDINKSIEHDLAKEQLALQNRSIRLQERMVAVIEKVFNSDVSEM